MVMRGEGLSSHHHLPFTTYYSRFLNRDLLHHHVALRAVAGVRGRGGDLVHHALTLDDAAELGVGGRQRVVRVHDEELRAVGVRPGVGHRHGALGVGAAVEFGRAVDLVVEAPAPGRLAAAPGPLRVAALDHEALDDAVEDDAVVLALLGQQPEVLRRLRRVLLQQLEADRPHVRLDACDAVSHDAPLGSMKWERRTMSRQAKLFSSSLGIPTSAFRTNLSIASATPPSSLVAVAWKRPVAWRPGS